jgi:hypothetical protein
MERRRGGTARKTEVLADGWDGLRQPVSGETEGSSCDPGDSVTFGRDKHVRYCTVQVSHQEDDRQSV